MSHLDITPLLTLAYKWSPRGLRLHGFELRGENLTFGCFSSLGIWGSFYAILLQRVLKEEKQITPEEDNEKEMLGKEKVFLGFDLL